ncbi:MAG: hypothetical protein MRJ68_05920 [Nitrospira sp.]|nr:hypothetical protein [Nitrospira sp.]
MAEIQRADDRSRKLAIVAVILVLIGGVVLWMVFEEWMAEVRSLPVEEAKQSLSRVFLLCMGIMIVCVCIVGWHSWWVGERVRQTLRFPPPDAKVVRDTVVLSGQAAAARGRLLKVFGVILMFCAMALGVMCWWVFTMFPGVLG